MRRILYIYMYVCVSSAHVQHGLHQKRSHGTLTLLRGWTFCGIECPGERAPIERWRGGAFTLTNYTSYCKTPRFHNKIPLGGEQTEKKHFRENRVLIYPPLPGLARNEYGGNTPAGPSGNSFSSPEKKRWLVPLSTIPCGRTGTHTTTHTATHTQHILQHILQHTGLVP